MNQLPNFKAIEIESFPKKLEALLNHNRQEIERLCLQENPSWASLMSPLDDLDDKLNQMWSPFSHMNSVVNSPEIRKSYEQCIEMLSNYGTEIGQNQKLYQAITKVEGQNEIEDKIIADDLLDFKLSGVALPSEQKERYKEIAERLSKLSTEFSNHVLDATNAWKKTITDLNLLKGLPQHAIDTAKNKDEESWTLTLDFPCFHAVVTYCENQPLREEMYKAYVTRASELGDDKGKFDNTPLMQDILKLRHEKAKLLGFDNYTELSLARKMAESGEEVLDFLIQLADKSHPQAKEEYKALEAFAGQPLNPWDISYYSEKQRKQEFDISQEELRPYFPEDKVVNGMFEIANRLYGIQFEELTAVDTWHENVRYYQILNADGSVKGGLYTDLYARAHKNGGAWMDDLIAHRKLSDGNIQKPVAFLTCNFAPGGENEQAYLSHDEVLTLFHEFGHCLHHLMTEVEYLSASGINGVEWDAVELPSQFFENWCWDFESLTLMSEHKETQATLPQTLFDKLTKARNFQSAMMMMRQLEFALFDFTIHKDYNSETPKPILETLEDIRKKYSVIPHIKENRFPNSFGHIFAGGYAAGYYSYKWAEVLSSDAFSRFEEEGIFNQETGRSFLKEILAKGSSRKAIDSFISFRGRKPELDALLRHSGIQA